MEAKFHEKSLQGKGEVWLILKGGHMQNFPMVKNRPPCSRLFQKARPKRMAAHRGKAVNVLVSFALKKVFPYLYPLFTLKLLVYIISIR